MPKQISIAQIAKKTPFLSRLIRCLLGVLWIAGALTLCAQEASFFQVQQLFEQAQTAHADRYCSNYYQAAEKYFLRAQEDSLIGKSPQRMQRNLDDATLHLQKALELTSQLHSHCPSLIVAFDQAVAARAAELALKSYSRALDLFQTAVDQLERGERDKTAVTAAQAEEAFRLAELEAILNSTFAPVRELLKQAERADCPKRTPRSYASI
ncbi:MAG: hypothetical protein ABH878_07295, partial [bacterium]